MDKQFLDAFQKILEYEGGYSNNSHDFGGKTNFGITQYTYNNWRIKKNLPIQDVSLLTTEEAQQLYYEEYWLTSGCDKIILVSKLNLAFIQFDVAVQRGPVNAICMLQKICGIDPQTGYFGNKTFNCVKLALENSMVYLYLSDMQKHFITRVNTDPSQQIFIKGWINRLDQIAKVVGSTWSSNSNNIAAV